MFEVSYIKNYNGTIKKWRFSENHKSRAFYKATVSSLKGADTVIRLPGDGTAFYIQEEPRLNKSYKPEILLFKRRKNNLVRRGYSRSEDLHKKHVSFERIFENSADDVKKILMFHLDIFA